MVNVLERFNKTMKENFMLDREKGKLLSYIILSLLGILLQMKTMVLVGKTPYTR